MCQPASTTASGSASAGRARRNAGRPSGDVYVTVRVRPLAGVERDGDHLRVRASVTMTEAALGTTVKGVPTPDGPLDVELAPARNRAPCAVRGRGLPSLETGRPAIFSCGSTFASEAAHGRAARRGAAARERARPGPYRDEEDDDGFLGRLKNAFR